MKVVMCPRAVAVALLFVLLSVPLAAQQAKPETLDKQMHFGGGLALSMTLGAATRKPWLGLAAGVGAGMAKEAHDSFQRGNRWDNADFAATAGGAVVGYVVLKLIFHKHRPGTVAEANSSDSVVPRPVGRPASAAKTTPVQTFAEP